MTSGKKAGFSLVLALCFVLSLPCLCPAQSGKAQPNQAGKKNMSEVSVWGAPHIEVYTDYAADAEVSGADVDMKYSTYGVMVKFWKLNFRYENRDYSWDDTSKVPFSSSRDDPWGTLKTLALGFRHNGRFNQKWGYFVSAGLSSFYEDKVEDGFGGFGYGAINYSITPKIMISAGGGVAYAHKVGIFIPIVGFVFNPGATKGFSGSLGVPRTEIKYSFSRNLAIRLAADRDARVYGLREGSPVRDGGYIENVEWKGGLYLDMLFADHFKLTVGGRYLFNREFITYDDDGDENSKAYYEVDPSWGGVVRLTYLF